MAPADMAQFVGQHPGQLVRRFCFLHQFVEYQHAPAGQGHGIDHVDLDQLHGDRRTAVVHALHQRGQGRFAFTGVAAVRFKIADQCQSDLPLPRLWHERTQPARRGQHCGNNRGAGCREKDAGPCQTKAVDPAAIGGPLGHPVQQVGGRIGRNQQAPASLIVPLENQAIRAPFDQA